MKNRLVCGLLLTILALPSLSLAENITITVKGMVCSFCAQGIKKTFSKKEEVKDIKLDLDQKLVILEMHRGTTISDEEIASTINDSGYDVAKIVRSK